MKRFLEKSQICADFKTTPTVLMLGSNIDDMNGTYKVIDPERKRDCDIQYEKSIDRTSCYVFSEKWHGRPGRVTSLDVVFGWKNNREQEGRHPQRIPLHVTLVELALSLGNGPDCVDGQSGKRWMTWRRLCL